MAAWGLLKGLGEGLSFAGASMAKTQEDQAKEARLEEYRKAAALEQRQYQEGQTAKQWAREDTKAETTVAKTKEFVRDGQIVRVDVNAQGDPLGEEYSGGQAKKDYGHLIKTGRGGLYNAETQSVISEPAPYGGSGSGSGKVQVVTATAADGSKIPMALGPNGWEPIPVPGGDAKPAMNQKRLNGLIAAAKVLTDVGASRELTEAEAKALDTYNAEINNMLVPQAEPNGGKDNPYPVDTPEDASKLPEGAFFTIRGRPGSLGKAGPPKKGAEGLLDKSAKPADEAKPAPVADRPPAAKPEAPTASTDTPAKPQIVDYDALYKKYKLPDAVGRMSRGSMGPKPASDATKEITGLISGAKVEQTTYKQQREEGAFYKRPQGRPLKGVSEDALRAALSERPSGYERRAILDELRMREEK